MGPLSLVSTFVSLVFLANPIFGSCTMGSGRSIVNVPRGLLFSGLLSFPQKFSLCSRKTVLSDFECFSQLSFSACAIIGAPQKTTLTSSRP